MNQRKWEMARSSPATSMDGRRLLLPLVSAQGFDCPFIATPVRIARLAASARNDLADLV
ncbi:MAG TPA: hypothetical protein VN937_13980 [Blastocatellia bacterium]|nr:hypothetical protein [Blastocatellia bacterium]